MTVAAAAKKTTRPNDERIWRPCGKCSGKGFITGLDHIAGGVCFACTGDKGSWTTVGKEKARKAAAKRRKAKASADANKRWEADVRRRKAQGETYEDWHVDCCLCGKPEGCNMETKAMFDAVV